MRNWTSNKFKQRSFAGSSIPGLGDFDPGRGWRPSFGRSGGSWIMHFHCEHRANGPALAASFVATHASGSHLVLRKQTKRGQRAQTHGRRLLFSSPIPCATGASFSNNMTRVCTVYMCFHFKPSPKCSSNMFDQSLLIISSIPLPTIRGNRDKDLDHFQQKQT